MICNIIMQRADESQEARKFGPGAQGRNVGPGADGERPSRGRARKVMR